MARRLVVCADGTWNEPNQASPTNVVRLARAVLPSDEKSTGQVVCYHKGVGQRGGFLDHLSGGAFGLGIDETIEDLYIFLANNYSAGDELFLFGFSRGAYTVRSLAGLIRKCGILRRQKLEKYHDAYQLYRDRSPESEPSKPGPTEFRQKYSWPEFNIRFIGVWDTVGSLGIPVTPLRFWNKKNFEFHDVQLSRFVDYAYQALAIDEQRKPFLPAIWKQHPQAPATQVLEQAWFPGVHCDVGGGSAACGLSDGALLWLWDRATRVGLALDEEARPKPNPADVLGKSMTRFYRLLGNGTRTLGDPPCLHQSTTARKQAVPNYAPANLEEFLRRHPHPPSDPFSP